MHIDGLVQERRNSSALAVELRLSCTKPSIVLMANKICFVVLCSNVVMSSLRIFMSPIYPHSSGVPHWCCNRQVSQSIR